MDWGMSRAELARHLGVASDAISQWEHGKRNPNASSLKRLSEWFAENKPERIDKRKKYADLGQRIKTRREEWKLTQGELANHLNVAVANIGNWERNAAIPSPSNLGRISKWLAEDVPERPDTQQAEDFAQRIREKRREWGMNLTELAKYLGVDRTTVREWENGFHLPTCANVRRLRLWFVEDAPEKPDRMSKYIELGAHIKEKRKALGITQAQLAKHLGVGKNRIHEWERGETVLRHQSLELVTKWLNEVRDAVHSW